MTDAGTARAEIGMGGEVVSGAVLAIRDLALALRGRVVLDGLDLALFAGELLALLGPNGAGKSTLIRCICGRLAPDRGAVRVVALDPRRSAAARAAIGLVPQQIALYPYLSVRENLVAFAALAGLARAERRNAVDTILRGCDLAAVAEHTVGTLSGGWQRRVNIAAALLHRPRLLVLDEPTVGVDPPARSQIEALLSRLAADGMSILITSHELEQLERLAHRTAFLRDGRIVADGAPDALLEQRFGDRRECRISLHRPAEPSRLLRLTAAGLHACSEDGRHWRGLIPIEAARSLSIELAGATDVERLGVQRPGLDTLWREIYGTEPDRRA